MIKKKKSNTRGSVQNFDFYNKKGIADTSRKGYYQEKINFFLSTLEKTKKGNPEILDIACNDGELTQKYQKYGHVLGIDINQKAVDSCKKKGLDCIISTVEDLPEKYTEYFDVIIAGDIIEHIFDTDTFLQSIHKRLKSGGTLLLTTPNLTSFGRRILMLFGKNPYIEYSTKLPYEEFNVGHVRYYTKTDLLNQLTHYGYKNIAIQGDRINISKSVLIPYSIASRFPTLSRNLMVICQK